MNHWVFVTAAYVVAIVGTGGLLGWAYLSMRRAEHRAGELTGR